MKNYIRSALDTLEALDFRLDHEDRKIRTDRWIFSHANEPETRLTLNFKMSEQAARTVVQRAKQIVGLATVGVGKPAAKANQRAKVERANEARRRAAAQELANARDAARAATRLVTAAQKRHAELERLLAGRATQVTIEDVFPEDMLTAEQIADRTGLTDAAVRRAISSGRLEGYVCRGGVVKVKGADVRSWLGAA